MAGSEESGEDIQAGRTNRAENRTRIWAQREEDGAFDGPAIFVVESALDIEDDDFEQVSESQDLHGIISSGSGGGAGVIGLNRRHPIFAPGEELSTDDIAHTKSVGVFGKGITGVVGQGDIRGTSDKPGEGIGVLGRGGAHALNYVAGVVGFSGSVAAEDQPRDTGVFGQGAVGVSGRGVASAGVEGRGGPVETGVVGFGGKGKDASGNPSQGVGVTGVGRGEALFGPAPLGTGVYGLGTDGVRGRGAEGRGGIFESDPSAQVRLIPAKLRPLRERPTLKPTGVPNPLPALPGRGAGGDLMTVVDPLGFCTLWFCVSGAGGATPARWAQVMLGPMFEGTV